VSLRDVRVRNFPGALTLHSVAIIREARLFLLEFAPSCVLHVDRVYAVRPSVKLVVGYVINEFVSLDLDLIELRIVLLHLFLTLRMVSLYKNEAKSERVVSLYW